MKTAYATLLVSIALLQGCAGDSEFNEDSFARLQPGHTTISEAMDILDAAPIQTVRFPDGSQTFTWQYDCVNWWRAGYTQPKVAALTFDPDGHFKQAFRFLHVPLDSSAQEQVKIGYAVTRY